jgi:hypothetical protein
MRGSRAGNFCRRRHQLPAAAGSLQSRKPSFHLCFQHGTGIAHRVRAAMSGTCRGSAMLLALGAASAALDAIKSLTASKPTSSQPIGFAPAGASWSDDSTTPSGGSGAATGYSGGPQISPDNIGALLAAQSQSTGFQAGGTSANSALPATTASSAASSTYSAVDQLIQRQSTPALLPTPPISVNV